MPTGYSNKTGENPFKGKKRKPFTLEHREKIGLSSLGRTAWNKGKKLKPHTEETKRKMRAVHKRGVQHHAWKGSAVGYDALHAWIVRVLGAAKTHVCKKCGTKNGLQWANKDHKYTRDLKKWFVLCRKCHYHYDEDVLKVKHGYNRGL